MTKDSYVLVIIYIINHYLNKKIKKLKKFKKFKKLKKFKKFKKFKKLKKLKKLKIKKIKKKKIFFYVFELYFFKLELLYKFLF